MMTKTGGSLLPSSVDSRFDMGRPLHIHGTFPNPLAPEQVDPKEGIGGDYEAHTL